MNTKTRIAVVSTALVIVALAGFGGYTLGAANTDTSQVIRSAQCEAIKGLSLAPKVPYKTSAHECVWAYQISLSAALQRGTTQCLCG